MKFLSVNESMMGTSTFRKKSWKEKGIEQAKVSLKESAGEAR